MSATRITIYGISPNELTDRQKERLAQRLHDGLIENFDVSPETVDVEGYMKDVDRVGDDDE